jgi:hypothetical protein
MKNMQTTRKMVVVGLGEVLWDSRVSLFVNGETNKTVLMLNLMGKI